MAESKYIVFEVGDIRVAKPGEFYMLPLGDVIKCLIRTDGPVQILRPIPADRVEVTVKPEPEPYRAEGDWVHGPQGAIAYAGGPRGAIAIADELNGLAARIRELESELTRWKNGKE